MEICDDKICKIWPEFEFLDLGLSSQRFYSKIILPVTEKLESTQSEKEYKILKDCGGPSPNRFYNPLFTIKLNVYILEEIFF